MTDMSTKVIEMNICGDNTTYGKITIELTEDGGGSIESTLKTPCSYCNDSHCNMDCEEYKSQLVNDPEGMNIERENFFIFNSMMNALESLILAHAVAGIDVETPKYHEGFEDVVMACINHT